ncbi:abortive infection family protein [Actinomadura sp. KC216]|uniref:abortive infection family protein n=1 Tax=Actinomadura sp. KC216 TaxID=2530370 RepID=UPI001404931D|nr:abortive infection family protein [Actinomadura sp. KC216]
MYQLTLERPTGIKDEAWQAIAATQRRLGAALDAQDRPLAVGTAKELVEAIAKTVMSTRGQAAGALMDYDKCVTEAHKALNRLPGPDLSDDQTLRQLVQSAKGIATQLSAIRNAYGTGHGRSEQPPVNEEMVHLCLDGALLWSRWALRRLGVLTLSMPEPLIQDLEYGTFYGGDLAKRLNSAGLAELDPAVQRRVGLAVAQRAMRETFVVRREGVEACAQSGDLTIWPDAYRSAVFEGLFIDPSGRLTADDWSTEWASRVLTPLPAEQVIELIEGLRTKLAETSEPSLALDPFAGDYGLEQRLRAGAVYLPPGARDDWQLLAREVAVAVERA